MSEGCNLNNRFSTFSSNWVHNTKIEFSKKAARYFWGEHSSASTGTRSDFSWCKEGKLLLPRKMNLVPGSFRVSCFKISTTSTSCSGAGHKLLVLPRVSVLFCLRVQPFGGGLGLFCGKRRIWPRPCTTGES